LLKQLLTVSSGVKRGVKALVSRSPVFPVSGLETSLRKREDQVDDPGTNEP